MFELARTVIMSGVSIALLFTWAVFNGTNALMQETVFYIVDASSHSRFPLLNRVEVASVLECGVVSKHAVDSKHCSLTRRQIGSPEAETFPGHTNSLLLMMDLTPGYGPQDKNNTEITTPSRDVGDVATNTCNNGNGFCGDSCHKAYWDLHPADKGKLSLRVIFPCMAYRDSRILTTGVPDPYDSYPDRFALSGFDKLTVGFWQRKDLRLGVMINKEEVIEERQQTMSDVVPFKCNRFTEIVLSFEETKVVVLADSQQWTSKTFKRPAKGIHGIVIVFNVSIETIMFRYPN